jgi:hypothetical protein
MWFMRAVRWFGTSSLFDRLLCLLVGHDDMLARGSGVLRVRCLRCGRASPGITR